MNRRSLRISLSALVMALSWGSPASRVHQSTPRLPSSGSPASSPLTGSKKAPAQQSLPLNTWTHVAATSDDTTLRLCVNGTLVSSGNIPGGMILSSNGVLRIGGNSIWGEYFAGMIDEVRVYTRVLSAAEIVNDMNAPIRP
jgi:hypothetical protein